MYPRIVVEDDAIRRAITGDRFNFAAESQVYAIKYGMIRTLMVQGYEVLVDDTHTSPPSIQRLLEINPKADCCIVDTSVTECIKRATASGQADLIGVIGRHHQNLRDLAKLRPDDELPQGIALAVILTRAVEAIRQGVLNRMEHTKRV